MSASEPHVARLDGNRIWRVETEDGPVLQKLYAERGSWIHAWGRHAAGLLVGGKTSTRAAGRRATEARLLALWRAHGLDVPAELSARHPSLAGERTLVLEYVDGRLLSELLADATLPRAGRDALVERFAAEVASRHALALQHREAGLVQEHGGVQHVLVATGPGGRLRFVSFDLENAFAPRADLAPLLDKELTACLRSLARCAPGARPAPPGVAGAAGDDVSRDRVLRDDVAAFVRGYGDRARMQAAVRRYLRPPSPLWRAVWSIDRRRSARRGHGRGKFVMLEMLDEVLNRPAC